MSAGSRAGRTPARRLGQASLGDLPDHVGRVLVLAQALGAPFALVLSGVTAAGEKVDPPADVTAADLDQLVDRILGGRPVA